MPLLIWRVFVPNAPVFRSIDMLPLAREENMAAATLPGFCWEYWLWHSDWLNCPGDCSPELSVTFLLACQRRVAAGEECLCGCVRVTSFQRC